MDTFDKIIMCAFVAVITTAIVLSFSHRANCDYELWGEHGMSTRGSYLDLLIESEIDSLIVVDSSKPKPIGILYFKSWEKEEKENNHENKY